MFQNSQTHFKNLAANVITDRSNCLANNIVGLFYDFMSKIILF